MLQRFNLVKGLEDWEIQIIGIEFTISSDDGQRQELAMFSPQGLIIPRKRTAPNSMYRTNGYKPAITFHSTDGDFTMNDYGNCPW